MESSVMEVILATFQSSLDKKLEEESNLSAADKQALRDRFMTHFKQVIEFKCLFHLIAFRLALALSNNEWGQN